MNTYLAILIMASSTYLIRVLPMILFKEKINSPFIQRFLHYVPYCMLTAMIIPGIFNSTGSTNSAIAGFVTAIILGYMEKSLITVSIGAVIVTYIAECLL